MSDNPKGERCEFMQYHRPHDYRNIHGNPLRCDGLLPPKDADLERIAQEVAAIRELLSVAYGAPPRSTRLARMP